MKGSGVGEGADERDNPGDREEGRRKSENRRRKDGVGSWDHW